MPTEQETTDIRPLNPDDFEIVIRPHGRRKPLPWMAALASARIPYRLEQGESGWELLIPVKFASRAQRELAAYERVNCNWPPPKQVPAWAGSVYLDLHGVSFWVALAVIIFYLGTGPFDDQVPEMAAGAAETLKIKEGGWWRAVTALTLHADLSHVLANAACLFVFGQGVCRSIGSGLGWLAIFLTGAGGNLIAAYLAKTDYGAVGASTATFGALGLLVLFQFRRTFFHFRDLLTVWSQSWVAIVAGFALLGFLGTSPHADLAGHFYGFLSGLLLGMILLPVMDRRLPAWSQLLLGLLALGALSGAWRLALFA